MPAHEHAIIIGSSIAGMLTAAALAPHFNKITLLERDELPAGPHDRSGTPQSKHPHNVLTRGLKIMESLLPGLEDDIRASGAPFANWGKHVRTLTQNGWLQNIETELYSPVISRAMLEWLIRQRLTNTYPTVGIMQGVQVIDLLADDSRQQIRGVRLKQRGANAQVTELTGDFVIDAAGRASKMPDWLEALGYPRPAETVVDPKVGYATRLYRKPADYDKPWHIIYMPAKAPQTRGGAVFEIEDGVWMVALGGYAEDYPPNDEAGFIAFARSLSEPDIYDAILSAEPISDIVGYRRTNNVMRHYERLSRMPAGIAIVGDAVCGFNPIYGQGMTAAAMGAALLAECLREAGAELDAVGPKFQKRLAQQNSPIWLMSTGEDFRHKATEGQRPGWFARLTQIYLDWVLEVVVGNDALAEKFLYIVNLDAPPTALFQPAVMAAVMRHKLGGAARQ